MYISNKDQAVLLLFWGPLLRTAPGKAVWDRCISRSGLWVQRHRSLEQSGRLGS